VGFTPVLGAGTIAHGTAGQAAAAEDSPLGLFDALLQIATGDLPTGSTAPTGDALTGSQFIPAATPEQQAALNALFGQQLTDAPEPTVPEVGTTDEATPDVFAGFIETLTALESAIASGGPVDPALERKAAEALEAIAALLGVPVAPTPTIDPAITAAAATDAATAFDPLAIIESAATITRAVGDADPSETLSQSLPAATGATAAASAAAATTAATAEAELAAPAVASTSSAAEEPVPTDSAESELPPAIKELAEKLAKLAAALEQRAPALAERLTALADKLNSGEISAATLAKLGLKLDPKMPDGEIEAAIARLLAPGAEAKPAATASPAPFIAASLALPDQIVLPPKAKTAAPADAKPAAPTPPASEIEPEPEIEPASKPELRVAERPDTAQPQTAATRSSFAAAFQASTGTADTQTMQTNAAATAALPTTTAVAAETKAMHAAYSAPVRQINIPQVAFEIVRQVQAGASRFQIRLDPPELGRIDVKLDVDAAGNVNARMTVERAETLDLMQRDQRSLERALAQAGLDSSKTNLEFSLRQNPFAHQEQGQGGHGRSPYAPPGGTAEADEPLPAPHIIAYRGSATAGGVNLFV
jgi:flagellar hook-length control protein FliK